MARLGEERIAELLAGPHQAVLAVARLTKGPLAVPISYHFASGRFYMVTNPDSLHGRLMVKRGRATLTVQFEAVTGHAVFQWYVMAEGPVAFTDEDPSPHVRVILAKDRGDEWADQWASDGTAADDRVAVLDPERLSGFEFRESLGG
jgi:nitroimidazol reductase NimA-like FMN-containing flavoprotein (pyridoxamine 5'-phosphate oxidase superfamily)